MEFNEKMTATEFSLYKEAFWSAMRGADSRYVDLKDGKHSMTNTYMLPSNTAKDYAAKLKEHDLFRRIGTVANETKRDGTIYISDNDTLPQWVPDAGVIPVAEDSTFPKKTVRSHKLAIITAMDEDFVSDPHFDLEGYLVCQFSKRFGRAEEDAFINGTGEDMPKGILHDTHGAETGITVSGEIAFDDVLGLYFSVDKQYRTNGAWLMNDETALKLKRLKSADGQYLWNHNSDTLLGKPVHISEFMPSTGKPVAFGDFSYYWVIDRMPLTVRSLHEKFAMNNKTGYLGVEHLDGLLIRPEAVKVMSVGQ